MNGQTGIPERASAELRDQPLFLAWDILDDAGAVQREIAMQRGYKNARKSNLNLDNLEALQSVEPLFRTTQFEQVVRNNLKKGGTRLG